MANKVSSKRRVTEVGKGKKGGKKFLIKSGQLPRHSSNPAQSSKQDYERPAKRQTSKNHGTTRRGGGQQR